jgi:hypothetical protein
MPNLLVRKRRRKKLMKKVKDRINNTKRRSKRTNTKRMRRLFADALGLNGLII